MKYMLLTFSLLSCSPSTDNISNLKTVLSISVNNYFHECAIAGDEGHISSYYRHQKNTAQLLGYNSFKELLRLAKEQDEDEAKEVYKKLLECYLDEIFEKYKWKYNGSFHKLISKCDKVTIRDGGFDCCSNTNKDKILKTIDDKTIISMLKRNIQFKKVQERTFCECCGYPGIDWYIGEKLIAITSIQHSCALRYKGAPGDAHFTKKSAKWLTEWFASEGIPMVK